MVSTPASAATQAKPAAKTEPRAAAPGGLESSTLRVSVSKVDQKAYPMAFVLPYGQGRVFHCPLGHDVRAFSTPAVGELFRRGTAWAAGLSPTADR